MIVDIQPGQKFGKLTCVRPAGMKHKYRAFLWRCDCGREKIYPGSTVRTGKQRSCGCTRGYNSLSLDRSKSKLRAGGTNAKNRVDLIRQRVKARTASTTEARLSLLANVFKLTASSL